MMVMLAAYAVLLLVDRYVFYLRWGELGGFWIRRVLYLVPLWQPLFFAGSLPKWHAHGVALSIAAGTALLSVALNLPSIRRLFDPALAKLMGPPEAPFLVADTLTRVGGAVSEEFFFRWYVISVLYPWARWWAVLISAALFVVHHGVHPRASRLYSSRDYLVQAVAGCGLGVAALLGGSLLAPVVGHVLYNLVILATQFYRLPGIIRHFAGPGY